MARIVEPYMIYLVAGHVLEFGGAREKYSGRQIG